MTSANIKPIPPADRAGARRRGAQAGLPIVRPAEPRSDVQARFPDGSTFEGPIGTALGRFVEAAVPAGVLIMAAVVDDHMRDLSFAVTKDVEVIPVSVETSDGMRIFQRSLTLLLVVAAHELFPDAGVVVDHSMTRGGFYCEVVGRPPFSRGELTELRRRMADIVAADEPIIRTQIPLAEAVEIFRRQGYNDKVALFESAQGRTHISLVSLRGWHDYFYGHVVPSTRYLHLFDLQPVADGFVLASPHRSRPGAIPRYRRHSKLTAVFREHVEWMEAMELGDVAALNYAVRKGRIREVVLVAEALQERRIAEIAGKVANRHDRIKVVLIAGPSSAGKTTTAKRLAVQLLARGVRPISLELDNYFLEREMTPLLPNGAYDFESIHALDRPLFNAQMNQLMAGEEVTLPVYNFVTGKREAGRQLSITPDHVILVEGIHGLNPQLVEGMPAERLYRIYLSALTQLNIDSHNRVPTTDSRLIRRIVRDANYRGYSALQTLQRWESVLEGERRNIFVYQDNANEFFNSALLYEVAVLKPYVEPLLQQIDHDDISEYIEAGRLLAFLGWFLPTSDSVVPDNSLLREFIGGSSLATFAY